MIDVKKVLSGLSAASFFLGLLAYGAVQPADPEKTVILCKNNKVVRTIQIFQGGDGQCTTTYTKAGVDREVANARTRNSCERVLANIKGNLEKAAWQCRDISQVISQDATQ